MRVGYEFGEIEPSLLDHPIVSDVLEAVFCLHVVKTVVNNGGGAVLGSGLTGCLRLEASLAFLEVCWVEAWVFPLFLVFIIFRVREDWVGEG